MDYALPNPSEQGVLKPDAMAGSVFVYYKVRPPAPPAASVAVAKLIQAVIGNVKVTAQLMQRSDDTTTWMEIYTPVSDLAHFLPLLEQAYQDSGLCAYLLAGTQRHIEYFIPQALRTIADIPR